MRFLSAFAAIGFISVYLLGRMPPIERFHLWAISFAIPVVLVLNLVLLLVNIGLRKMWPVIFFFLALVVGGRYIFSTISIRSLFRSSTEKGMRAFTVVNYNLGGFKSGDASRDPADTSSQALVNWILTNDAEVQCYQEFPYHPKARPDVLDEFTRKGYDYFYAATEKQWDGSRFGILTVSRYPIVARGDVLVSSNQFNRIAFADILVNGDTIRIINVHLESMQMKRFHPGYSENFEAQKRDVRTVFRRLRGGIMERNNQINRLVAFVKESPYPVICAGDFNEMPYSFSYQLLNRELDNTFEDVGSGFGFTYNGKTLDILRIDHQFHSASIRPLDFNTLDSLRYSDHFPLWGKYALEE